MNSKKNRHDTPRNMIAYGRIVSTLPALAIARGFGHKVGGANEGKVNLRKLWHASGVSRPTLFYLIRYPETFVRVDVHTLARLCFALDCQPGDFLKYERIATPGVKGLGTKLEDLDDLDGVE